MPNHDHHLDQLSDLELDALLEQTSWVAKGVKGLPEDTVSMAWRSQLNEQLRAHAAAPARKPWWALAWRPAMGLGLAAIAGVMFISQNTVRPGSTSVVEDSILTIHHGAEVESAFGSALYGYANESNNRSDEVWQATDLELL